MRGEFAAQACWVGVSTHNLEQLREAGPHFGGLYCSGANFPDGTKANPDPVVGLELLRAARRLTRKPLVAIGGITIESAESSVSRGSGFGRRDSRSVVGARSGPTRALNIIGDCKRVRRGRD